MTDNCYPKVEFSFGVYTFRSDFAVNKDDWVICIVKNDYMVGKVVGFMTEDEYDQVSYVLKPVVGNVTRIIKNAIRR